MKINIENNYFIEIEIHSDKLVTVTFPACYIGINVESKKVVFRVDSDLINVEFEHTILSYAFNEKEDNILFVVKQIIDECLPDYGLSKSLVLINENEEYRPFYEEDTFSI